MSLSPCLVPFMLKAFPICLGILGRSSFKKEAPTIWLQTLWTGLVLRGAFLGGSGAQLMLLSLDLSPWADWFLQRGACSYPTESLFSGVAAGTGDPPFCRQSLILSMVRHLLPPLLSPRVTEKFSFHPQLIRKKFAERMGSGEGGSKSFLKGTFTVSHSSSLLLSEASGHSPSWGFPSIKVESGLLLDAFLFYWHVRVHFLNFALAGTAGPSTFPFPKLSCVLLPQAVLSMILLSIPVLFRIKKWS